MNPDTLTTSSTLLLAAHFPTTVMVALLGLAPLAAGYWLLVRAVRRPATMAIGRRDNVAASLRSELIGNYDQLRRVGEAVPLVTDAWDRLGGRVQVMPPTTRKQIARTYDAIHVANRLLATSRAYDSRGHLSTRQRGISLWPTLETAVRTALVALGSDVTQAQQATIRLAPADTTAAVPVATTPKPFRLAEAPRLSLFYGNHATASNEAVPEPAPVAPSRPVAKTTPPLRPTRKRRRDCHGQMPLWESVA
jgi:hypothetical protein